MVEVNPGDPGQVSTVTGGMDSECHAIFSHDTDSFIDSHTPHGYPGCAWSV